MNTNPEVKFKKPKILPAFVSGFNTTANNIHLIILPIIVDLFLWFGPRFSLERFLSPFVEKIPQLPGFDTPQISELIGDFTTLLAEITAQFNLSILIRTFPVGVPSLISGISPNNNPVGTPVKLDLLTSGNVIVSLIAVLLLGFIFGSFFFQQTASSILTDIKKRTLGDFTKATLQIILLPVILIAVLFFISIPGMLIISILNILSPMIGQIGLFIILVLMIWLLIPLFFTPHSIYLYRQNLITSLMTSISVARFSLPGSAIFLLSAFFLSEGSDMLWLVPPTDSWMLLVGILGHAFISTAVLASSYHYFLNATQFTQSVLNNLKKDTLTSKI